MISVLLTHLVKDLRIEWRSREAINFMITRSSTVAILATTPSARDIESARVMTSCSKGNRPMDKSA